MRFFSATYCAMDQDTGANPFWHACLLISRFDDVTNKLEVVDTWSFYGLPTTDKDSIFRNVKIQMGLDVDLTGNHGMVRPEELRRLDIGKGLHGVTFELTEEKFNELRQRCVRMAEEQHQAIDEIVKPINLRGKEPKNTRIYPYEDWSQQIYALEEARAQQEGRPSRLKRFALSLLEPRTCKMQVLDFLDGIITPEQHKRITGISRRTTRFSGPLETIFLHSSGSLHKHVKRNGEVVYFREWGDPDIKLHWTFPPQEIETLSGDTRRFFKIEDEHIDAIKDVISQLQQLEWFFMNATFTDIKCLAYQAQIIAHVKAYYEAFAVIEPKKANPIENTWANSFLCLLSQPRNTDEAILLDKLERANVFLLTLYSAAVDNWDKKGEEHDLDDDIEMLVAYLPEEKKKQLCGVLNRNYLEPEVELRTISAS